MRNSQSSKANKSEGKIWWSSLKKGIESRFDPFIRRSVNVHMTRYRGSHYDCQCDDGAGAVWITVDKEEVFRAADLTFRKHLEEHLRDLCQELGVSKEYCYRSRDIVSRAVKELAAVGVTDCDTCLDLMVGFGDAKIDQAVDTDSLVLKLLAVFDERTSSEQLIALEKRVKDDSLLRRMITFRREANDGVETGDVRNSSHSAKI